MFIKNGLPLRTFCAFALLGLSSSVLANVAFVKQDGYNPWGDSPSNPGSHEGVMDTAFGAGNWDNLSFEHVNATELFSSAYTFIYLEGASTSAEILEVFLAENNGLIGSWVSNGGRLFINSAPNQGDGMDLGFGLHLNYNNGMNTACNKAIAADSSHVIFNGPHGTTGDSFSGDAFGHSIITGNGLKALILGELEDGGTGIVLGEIEWGEGHVLVGGMTSAEHQEPQPGVYNLWANVLSYGAAIPEPSTYALFGAAGLVGLITVRRRKN